MQDTCTNAHSIDSEFFANKKQITSFYAKKSDQPDILSLLVCTEHGLICMLLLQSAVVMKPWPPQQIHTFEI